MQYTWKIGGEAGFGIMTTGLLFAKIAARSGYNTFDFVEYPSLIRGGHNAYDVTFGDEKVSVLKPSIDLLICLNKETYDLHKHKMAKDGLIVFDPEQFSPDTETGSIAIPFSKILKELNGQVIMKNMVALGASLALLGADLSELVAILGQQFGKKGDAIISLNRSFAEKGYEEVKKSYSTQIRSHLNKRDSQKKMVLTGNEAFAYGAVAADCRFYAAYPMTPSSGVLTALAAWGKKTGMVVRHSEDEIAVINSALGASFAGVRSAVGSSGGGFALMVEAVSLAGITELPLVIFISQRPGPATGMPTWTEQADLLFSIHSGHGEFQKIVLAPGDHQEMIEMTMYAFDMADKYQLPVIVLSDMLLSESHASVAFEEVQDYIGKHKPNRGKLLKTAEIPYNRYAITDDGVSPRLIPGQEGIFYQANSYEHLEDGHTTESAEERIKQVEKRNRKWETYLNTDFILPQIYGNTESAETIFVGWGSTKGVAVEAVKQAEQLGKKIAYIHFSSLYPLHEKKINEFFSPFIKKCVLVENNATAQLGKLLRMETGIFIEQKIVRFDGRPLTANQLLEFKK
jgi:2-oxoglutarate ferredoxin oxidoreductase subunit alpha